MYKTTITIEHKAYGDIEHIKKEIRESYQKEVVTYTISCEKIIEQSKEKDLVIF